MATAPSAAAAAQFVMDSTSTVLLSDLAANATQIVGIAKEATPNFGHLTLLVFEAVIEVVCVSFPGYVIARLGLFDGPSQRFVAGLNMNLFTPCLIFSKLARQLSKDKILELIIIPVILGIQTLISWTASKIVCRLFGLKKQPQLNFVTAMSVFGNSNSLPLSLVISLSKTISGLHWDKVPNDNDSQVAARGILYLLVFSQLGQALRWSWGMNTLLKPLDTYQPHEMIDEESHSHTPYEDSPPPSPLYSANGFDTEETPSSAERSRPSAARQRTISNGNLNPRTPNTAKNLDGSQEERRLSTTDTSSTWWKRAKRNAGRSILKWKSYISLKAEHTFAQLPPQTQKMLKQVGKYLKLCWIRFIDCLNPPLIAIIISVIVAVIPALQRFFFTPHTFVSNSVTAAVTQSGLVAVPLILVVLGANLAKNTLPDEGLTSKEYQREETKMVYASIVCRMFITGLLMGGVLTFIAKFINVSILDDPIFLIVCFLLAGAPPALQLAQMCQVNGVFVGAVSRLLFQTYVVFILPSTLFLVVVALEVLNWARQ